MEEFQAWRQTQKGVHAVVMHSFAHSFEKKDMQNGTYKEMGGRLKAARGNLSRSDLADRINVHPNTLARWESGERAPDAALVTRLCQELGISPNWLLTGEDEILNRKLHSMFSNFREEVAKVRSENAALVLVPKVLARLSAGTGSLETEAEEQGRYAFRSDWIRRKGRPEKMVLMDVSGDSMAPLIHPGDTVLIDQGQTDVRAGEIYAVGIEDAIYIKRLEMLPGTMVLVSENERHEPIKVPVAQMEEQVRVIGRVIWWCHEVRY